MPEKPTVVLFDVDGTLVSTGGAGRRSMSGAFGELFEAPHALDGISLAGMTDPLILRLAFEAIGLVSSPEKVDALLKAYLVHLRREVPASEKYRVMAGVPNMVEHLANVRHVAMGLGTGNIEEGARVKLDRAALSNPFTFGGFGSDAEDRGELLRIGATRGAQKLGLPLERCRVVIVGDTTKDVAAAHAIGATCVAVATGGSSIEQLQEAGADHVFQNLSSAQALRAVLESDG